MKLSFILLNNSETPLENYIRNLGITVARIRYRGKRDFPVAFIRLVGLLRRWQPDTVHVHLWDAQLIALPAAWILRIPQRIYTRHTSNFHHLYERKGIKYDRACNFLATTIVSISQSTDRTLIELERVPREKVVKIHHGFDLNAFRDVEPSRVEEVAARWGIRPGSPVVGVIARHIEWKGIQFIIPAFGEFLQHHPSAMLVLANADGPYHSDIKKQLTNLPASSYRLIPFENDIAALFRTFDIYVHVPVDATCEAFGQTYVEALASTVPSVFTLSGVAAEFIQPDHNAVVVDFRNSDQIAASLYRLWNDPSLRQRIAVQGCEDVKDFDAAPMIDKLLRLYRVES